MKKQQLTKLRLQLEKLVIELQIAENEGDKPTSLVCIPDPVLVDLENLVRDLKNWRGI